jgi:hypothetical protein
MLHQDIRLDVFSRGRRGRRRRNHFLGDVGERDRSARAARRQTQLALDEICPDRSTDHAARDDADHRGGDGKCRRADHAGFFKLRREGEARGRSAGERYRPGEHAHQRVLPERPRHRGAQHVLHHRDDQRKDEEGEDQRTTAFEQRKAGGESDRCKERVLKRDLQGGVELQRLNTGEVEHCENAGDRKAADNGCRDVDLAENGNEPSNAVAGEQDDAGKRNGLNEIESYRQHDAKYTRTAVTARW